MLLPQVPESQTPVRVWPSIQSSQAGIHTYIHTAPYMGIKRHGNICIHSFIHSMLRVGRRRISSQTTRRSWRRPREARRCGLFDIISTIAAASQRNWELIKAVEELGPPGGAGTGCHGVNLSHPETHLTGIWSALLSRNDPGPRAWTHALLQRHGRICTIDTLPGKYVCMYLHRRNAALGSQAYTAARKILHRH